MEKSAGYMTMGLHLGIVSTDDVQSWVNVELANTETPSDKPIELAHSNNESLKTYTLCLKSIEEELNTYQAIRVLLSEINEEQLASVEFCRRLAECLYGVWVENIYEAPKDLNLIGFLYDQYSLAKQGYYGTMDG